VCGGDAVKLEEIFSGGFLTKAGVGAGGMGRGWIGDPKVVGPWS